MLTITYTFWYEIKILIVLSVMCSGLSITIPFLNFVPTDFPSLVDDGDAGSKKKWEKEVFERFVIFSINLSFCIKSTAKSLE